MPRLIFIDSGVLGGFISSVPSSLSPFDSNACSAFVELMKRVDDASIVILSSYSSSLEDTQRIWEENGLFGNRIIDVIGSRGGILFPSHSVHNYLRSYPLCNKVNSFVIVDRMPCEDSYPDRLFVVDKRLTSDHIEGLVEILNRPFSSWQILRDYREPAHPRGEECVCS